MGDEQTKVSRRKNAAQRGVYLSLMALSSIALLAILILAIGAGFVLTGKTRLQNITNVAALAALESFTSSEGASFSARASDSLTRANFILGQNSVPGFEPLLGALHPAGAPGEYNSLTLGTYHAREPNDTDDPCNGDYPCFLPLLTGSAPASATANAARIDIQLPISFGLGNFLGRGSFSVATTSVATMRPQCTGYILDVSMSTTSETHQLISNAGQHPCVALGLGCNTPACQDLVTTPGFYDVCRNCKNQSPCYPARAIKTAPFPGWGSDDDPPPVPSIQPITVGLPFYRLGSSADGVCTSEAALSDTDHPERIYWCNTPNAPVSGSPAQPGPGDPVQHMRQHYRTLNSPLGEVRVDSLHIDNVYEGPQPFIRFMKAFNVGLRQVQARATVGDSALFSVFVGRVRDTYPTFADDGEYLTENLGFLIQLTNAENRGLFDWNNNAVPGKSRIHPNFVDRGWFPIPDGAQINTRTNLVVALYTTAITLMQNCPVGSKKSIVLATDGLGVCTYNPEIGGDAGIDCGTGTSLNRYLASNSQLIGGGLPGEWQDIKAMLNEGEISLTTLLDSSRLRLELFNRENEDAECGAWTPGVGFANEDPACYVSATQARAFGYVQTDPDDPSPENLETWFLDSRSLKSDGTVGTLAEVWADPNGAIGLAPGVMANISIGSGGIVCPLLQTADASWYYDPTGGGRNCAIPCTDCQPCVLKSQYRDPSGSTVLSPTYLTKSEQAADCVSKAVTAVPFILAETARFE